MSHGNTLLSFFIIVIYKLLIDIAMKLTWMNSDNERKTISIYINLRKYVWLFLHRNAQLTPFEVTCFPSTKLRSLRNSPVTSASLRILLVPFLSFMPMLPAFNWISFFVPISRLWINSIVLDHVVSSSDHRRICFISTRSFPFRVRGLTNNNNDFHHLNYLKTCPCRGNPFWLWQAFR